MIDEDMKIGGLVALAIFFLGMGLAFSIVSALSHEAHQHPSLVGWAEEQMVTPEYGRNRGICPEQDPNNVQCKCCNESEIPKAEYRVSTGAIDERGYPKEEWWYKREGSDQWRMVPEDVIHWGEHAPDGQPVLFLLGGKERCFFPGRTDL